MKSIIIKYKRIIAEKIKFFLFYLFRIFPINKNKIYFQNFNGKGYGDNPKYIAEEIIRRGLNLKLIWAVKSGFNNNFPDIIKTVKIYSIRAIYESVTSKIWIDNCRKQSNVRKRKGQFYIQTWHGIGPKKSEKDYEQYLSVKYLERAKNDSNITNLYLSDSAFASQLYRLSFWYNGEILECGFPRNDIFVNQDDNIKTKVKNHFNISGNTKIILYAPTFRDNLSIDMYNIDYNFIISRLKEKTQENWIFLIRLHPNVSKMSEEISYNDNIFNASNYDDMQELLLATDMLITDYSSSIYEFSIMKKPVFLYVYDYVDYTNKRELFFDLYTLPYPVAVTSDELLQKILNFEEVSYLKALDCFMRKLGFFKFGQASESVVNRILEEIIN